MAGTWTKTRVLGSGRATTVWEGRDERLNRPVAIKELHGSLAARPGFVETYLAEARKMAAVSDARVLTLHAVDDSADPPRLVTELADGTTRDLLTDGALQPEQAARLLTHSLQGLGALHRQGIVHRGIKPENLFVRGDGYKVGDFGIGHTPETPTLFLSSPRYTAPELLGTTAAGSGGDPRADLYALGLVLYELLLGTSRWEEAVREAVAETTSPDGAAAPRGTGDFDLWLRFHREAPDLPPPAELEPAIPERLSRVVARLAAKDPETRYADAEAALRDLQDGRAPAAPHAAEDPTVAFTAAGEGERTHRRLGIAAGLVLTLLVGVVAAFVLWPSRGIRVSLRSEPPGAAVLAGGEPVGTTPVEELLVAVGGELTLRKEGFEDTVLRFDDPDRTVYEVALDPAPEPEPGPALSDPDALVRTLLDAVGPAAGPRLELARGAGSTLPFGTPLDLSVVPDREGGLVLLTVSPDGAVHRLYPGPGQRTFRVRAGERLTLPLPEDRAAGFDLVAAAPAGREAVFALVLGDPRPPPAPPQGERAHRWVVSYPFDGPESPAAELVAWVAKQRREDPDGTGLAALELDVVPGEERR